jgi:hypothetical protein
VTEASVVSVGVVLTAFGRAAAFTLIQRFGVGEMKAVEGMSEND